MWLGLFLRSAFFSPKKNALKGAILTFALAVMPLTLVYMLSQSMIDSIYEKSVETFYYHAQLNLTKSTSMHDIQKIRQQPYIQAVWQEKQNFALIYNPKEMREGILLRGLEPSFLSSKKFWGYLSDENNQLFTSPLELEKGELALAKGVAQLLNTHKGETLNVLTSRQIANRRVPRITPLKVKFIFSTGYKELDDLWGLVNLNEEKELFDKDSPSIWGVKFKDLKLNEIEAFTQKMNQEYQEKKISWVAWTQLNSTQRENFQSLQILFYVLLSLIILVAGFNLSSAIVIYTLEQSQEIAILRTLGLSPFSLKNLFILLACLVSFFGCMMGVVFSLLLSSCFKNLLNLILCGKYYLLKLLIPLLTNELSTESLEDFNVESCYISQLNLQLPFSFVAILLACCLILSALASLWATRRLIHFKPKLLLI